MTRRNIEFSLPCISRESQLKELQPVAKEEKAKESVEIKDLKSFLQLFKEESACEIRDTIYQLSFEKKDVDDLIKHIEDQEKKK